MSEVNSGPDSPETEQNSNSDPVTPETSNDAPESKSDGTTDNPADKGNGDTFPRSYVEELRKENADYRIKAKAAEDRAEVLARKLHTALVAATNRLENPADLPYDAMHVDDPDQLGAALDALLADRPYFAKRVVKGDAGQGPRGSSPQPFNLLEALGGAV